MKSFITSSLAGLCGCLLSAMALGSCSMMTDDRSDCPTGLYLTFKYDYNLQRADMFSDHVGAVDVYVFDEQGHYVTCQSAANTATGIGPLADPLYRMQMDLAPGKYQFIVLAGQKSYTEQLAAQRAHFVRTELAPGDSMSALEVRLDAQLRQRAVSDVNHLNAPLDTLWHGIHTGLVEVYPENPSYATISLVRDTKKINVTLRELEDPTEMDIHDYDLRIIDRNAHILWNNELDEADTVVYTPHALWNTDDRTPAFDGQGNEIVGTGHTGHADFMTSRILWHDDPAADGVLLVTHRPTGKVVARLNLPDCLSRLRTAEETAAYSRQEFLDRGYDYNLSLFLNDGRLVEVEVSISVLGWAQRWQLEEL